MGCVIKRCRFVELPAPDLVIQRVNTLASNSGVSSTLVFADHYKNPFDWPDNTATPTALDPTQMVAHPHLPAEMPGVLLERHVPFPDDSSPFDKPNEPDWLNLADKAAQNADLDNIEHLPPPPEVIELDDDDDMVYVPPHTTTSPVIKQESISSPTSASPVRRIQPPAKSTRTSVHDRHPPRHLNDFHLFSTVTDEHRQPPEHPYHTAGGTDVDLAIQDEQRMAHLCHFVMVHTATSLHLAQHGQPTKK